MTVDGAIETAIIYHFRDIYDKGAKKSASACDSVSVTAYRVGDVIRIDVKEKKDERK